MRRKLLSGGLAALALVGAAVAIAMAPAAQAADPVVVISNTSASSAVGQVPTESRPRLP